MKTARTHPLDIRDDSRIGSTLQLVCLVRHWPSLGITRDNPLFGLRRVGGGKTIARGRRDDLLEWAAKRLHDVREATP